MRRAVVLTTLLLALPALFLAPGAARIAGGEGAYRRALLWGLPAACGLLAALLSRRGGLVPAPVFSRGRALRLLPWCLLAIGVDQGFLFAGHAAGWLTLTWGDQALYASPLRALLWWAPLSVVFAVLGWEWPLRRVLCGAWSERLPPWGAMGASCATGLVLSLPSILGGSSAPDGAFTAAALVSAAGREVACAAIVMAGGGIGIAGLYRGLLWYAEACVINDWYSPFFPMANYTSSDGALYVVRGLAAVLAALTVVAGARVARARAVPAGDAARAGGRDPAPGGRVSP